MSLGTLPGHHYDIDDEWISNKGRETNDAIEEGQDDHDEGGDFVEVGLVNFEAAVCLGGIDKT